MVMARASLPHFCSPNSAKDLAVVLGQPSHEFQQVTSEMYHASCTSQRRACVEVCLACVRLDGGTGARNDVTAR